MRCAYPGETMRIAYFERSAEMGDVRIQVYETCFRVATFLPGIVVALPGDTPKIEPERSEWHTTRRDADQAYDRFTRDARADGWRSRILQINGSKS